mmetsp:Transcript_23314/g.54182  ORF Transcript_23314/g.54182 Transcript_23314/m.54182 type:complete len:208 (+) Transcript_23314:611-1234(+)
MGGGDRCRAGGAGEGGGGRGCRARRQGEGQVLGRGAPRRWAQVRVRGPGGHVAPGREGARRHGGRGGARGVPRVCLQRGHGVLHVPRHSRRRVVPKVQPPVRGGARHARPRVRAPGHLQAGLSAHPVARGAGLRHPRAGRRSQPLRPHSLSGLMPACPSHSVTPFAASHVHLLLLAMVAVGVFPVMWPRVRAASRACGQPHGSRPRW